MKDLLKFITCGSVDDGKSTLIGNMIYNSNLIYKDQKNEIKNEMKDDFFDYSLLLDGLVAEREQKITIDVAYKFFSTEIRSFIVADCPGHEQYTRNMAVGASFADAAIVIINASIGILEQTLRHIRICEFMGIKNMIVAINKMDLIDYDKDIFNSICYEIKDILKKAKLDSLYIVPTCAISGENITYYSDNMRWYRGKYLLEILEDLTVKEADDENEFILPVQRVCRPDYKFRGFQGNIESGTIRVNDEIQLLPSKEKAKVSKILVAGKGTRRGTSGQPVTLCLNKEIDVSRGDVIVKNSHVKRGNSFLIKILWMDSENLKLGKSYFLKCGTKTSIAIIKEIKYKIDISNDSHLEVKEIKKNEFALVHVVLLEDIIFKELSLDVSVGRIILIDRITNMTSACGKIEAICEIDINNLHEVKAKLSEKEKRYQDQYVLWFTGLSGAGKTTLANAVKKRLIEMGNNATMLDGDCVRSGLNKDLGFLKEDRSENIRRVAEVAKLMNKAGLIVLVSFISPYERDRCRAREIIGDKKFIEIFLSTSLEECEKRDPKGLYKKARKGEIQNFTGISQLYEKPINPQMTIDTSVINIEESVDLIVRELNNIFSS